MKPAPLLLSAGCALLSACSSAGGLSTSSIFGGGQEAAAQPTAPPAGDPTSRAFQVATVSARSVKCGFNFDPAKLKAAFMASEIGKGAAQAEVSRIEQIYDVSYNGVTKAVASEPNYCTDAKTKEIKAELNRHLAGDFTPAPPKKVVDSGGLFSGWGNGSGDAYKFNHPIDNR